MTHDALLSWYISALYTGSRILEPIPSVVEMPSIPGIATSIRMMERSE